MSRLPSIRFISNPDGLWNPTKAIAANVTAYATWILSTGIGAMAGKSIAFVADRDELYPDRDVHLSARFTD